MAAVLELALPSRLASNSQESIYLHASASLELGLKANEARTTIEYAGLRPPSGELWKGEQEELSLKRLAPQDSLGKGKRVNPGKRQLPVSGDSKCF